MGVGEQEPEQKRRGACQEPTGEKVFHVLADGGRATYTDGRTDGTGGGGGTESATTKEMRAQMKGWRDNVGIKDVGGNESVGRRNCHHSASQLF